MALHVLPEHGKEYRSRIGFAIRKSNKLLGDICNAAREIDIGFGYISSAPHFTVGVLGYPLFVAINWFYSFADLEKTESGRYIER